ncbi:hypothetical protein [Parapedobacter sp. 10938]|uniref:hypothetical protein n=1 Tax=Parapedobacter flavus TaxID=3110225 RepID=UPI002DBA233A|nr:hypothetical protein [Parapedobacter sp. 10938]MEC3880624.1 hypothetical protein [Parapedobacter sp. 10938]
MANVSIRPILKRGFPLFWKSGNQISDGKHTAENTLKTGISISTLSPYIFVAEMMLMKTLIPNGPPVSRRILPVLLLPLCALFSSCFQLIKEMTVNSDGSGTFALTANLSQSRSKLASVMLLDSINGHKVPSKPDVRKEISLDRYIAFHKLFGSMGDFYFKSNGVKGNRISGEFVAQTPAGFDNSLQYLFSLVDYATEQR